MSTTPTYLADRLGETVERFMASLPDNEAQLTGRSFQKLYASHTGENAISVGEIVPDFTLPNAHSEPVTLYSLLNSGPVVLNFYRGGWCPFCNLELQALQARLSEVHALGAALVGISPELPDSSLGTVEKHALDFEVLSDVGNRVARKYGLLFTVYEEMRPLYLKWGLDVPAVNGDDSWELPVPATFVVDSNAVVRAAHVDKDYTRRMEPEAVLDALRALRR